MWKLILAQLVVCLVQYYIATTDIVAVGRLITVMFNLIAYCKNRKGKESNEN